MKKKFYVPIISIGSILIVFISFALIPRSQYGESNPWIIEDGERPMVIAHAGGNDLFPANTIMAFEEVSKMNVDVLEMDLTLTSDDILITHHDKTIDRLSNGTGAVRNFTYAELLQFDFADNFLGSNNETYYGHEKAKPETMENMFLKYPSWLYIIELKNRGEDGYIAANLLAQLIAKYQMEEKVIVASFDDDINQKFREYSNGTAMTSTARAETTKFVILEKLRLGLFYKSDHAALHVPISEEVKGIKIRMDKKHFINEAHRHNMAVNFWTVNNKEDMRHLIELGADGIMTDRPDIMMELLDEMGF